MDLADFLKLFKRTSPPQPKMKRGSERHFVEGLQCTLGGVLDVSATGMKVWSLRPPAVTQGMDLPLVLADGDQRLAVNGKVMWVRKPKSGMGWHIGFRFERPSDAVKTAIETYAKVGYFTTDPVVRRELYQGESDCEPLSRASRPEARPAPTVSVEIVDLYAIVGVDRRASDEEIHLAYRRLARSVHPDSNQDPDAAEQFARLSKAFSVLHDPERRAKYDQMLESAKRAA